MAPEYITNEYKDKKKKEKDKKDNKHELKIHPFFLNMAAVNYARMKGIQQGYKKGIYPFLTTLKINDKEIIEPLNESKYKNLKKLSSNFQDTYTGKLLKNLGSKLKNKRLLDNEYQLLDLTERQIGEQLETNQNIKLSSGEIGYGQSPYAQNFKNVEKTIKLNNDENLKLEFKLPQMFRNYKPEEQQNRKIGYDPELTTQTIKDNIKLLNSNPNEFIKDIDKPKYTLSSQEELEYLDNILN